MRAMLRDFVPADASAVNAVAAEAWAQYRPSYSDQALLDSNLARTAELASTAELIVADIDGQVIGVVGYVGPSAERHPMFEPGWTIMRMLVVKPSARGHGIGRLLAAECISRARRDGAAYMALHTAEIMQVALGMYQRMGFNYLRPLADMNGVKYGLYLKSLAV
jgi:GNAT superfamily N-acetyltransferase